ARASHGPPGHLPDAAPPGRIAPDRGGNNPPTVAVPLPDQHVTEAVPFVITIPITTFADPDPNDRLRLSATTPSGGPLPSGVTFDPAATTLSGTFYSPGTIDIRITATDQAGASASDIFTLIIDNTNDPPYVVQFIPDPSVIVNKPLSFTFSAGVFSDADPGDQHVYTATLVGGEPLPGWLAFDPASRTFSGTPTFADAGVYAISVRATDQAGASAYAGFLIFARQHRAYLPLTLRP
ncbi:MAG TPA: putative Ig domain-containing protein, partial [Herpetosiphonaceae bacterium]